MEIVLANPRGFCAGVERAIEIVERALEAFGAPVYVRHEVVHNRFVIDRLRALGAVFVEELAAVPAGATVIFSAHGVSRAVVEEARQRGLQIFDATCPLVTKVHVEVAALARKGFDVVLIGHAGHPEVEGTLGRFDPRHGGSIHLVETPEDVARLKVRDARQVAYVTQTTLSVDDTERVVAALRERFPAMAAPRRDDICYATQNRQDAVRDLAREVDLVLVVGSATSSNSNRLHELAEQCGRPAYLIDGPEDIRPQWLDGITRVGVTAGASAPETLVRAVIDHLRAAGGEVRELPGPAETIVFALPRALRGVSAA
jgi:4-hydroxy-3-methylbut-2-enyl diphosphate reductase